MKALTITMLLFFVGSLQTMAIPWSPDNWQNTAKTSEHQLSLSKLFTGNFGYNQTANLFFNPVDETTIFEESFEGADIPESWTVINTHSNPDSNWHIRTGAASQGTHSMEVTYSDGNMMDEWMISPSIDFSAYSGQNINLTFDFFMSYYWMVNPFDGADFMVKISTDNGANWTEVWQEGDYGVFNNFEWYSTGVSLSAYAGEANVKIAFQFLGDDGAQTLFDNVKIAVEGDDDGEPDNGCFGDNFNELTNGGNTSTSGENGPSSSEWDGNENFPVVSKAYEAGGAVKLGTGSLSGFIQSKELDDVSGEISVEIDVKGWTNVEGELIVSIDGQEQTLSYSAVMADAFETVNANFIGVTAGAVLKIETTAKRAFIDTVNVICGDTPPPPLEGCSFASGYGTATAPDVCMSSATFSTCNYAGEYTTTLDVVAGNQYSFASDIDTDFLTIREGSADGPIIGVGITPVIVTATTNGSLYMHIAADEDCNPESVCRTTTVSCESCAPLEDYCIVNSTNTNYGIGNFATTGGVENIDNTTGSGTYTNYSDMFVSQYPGQSVEFSVSGAGDENQTYGYGLWIDWNNDFCFFGEGEEIYNSGQYIATANGEITVPEGTLPGDYRIRVVNNWLASSPVPCGSLGSTSYGEAEDYTFRVLESGGSTDEDCDQGDDSNNFENGLQIGAGTDFRNADDFFVSSGNTLHIVQIEINAIYMLNNAESIDLIFYEDDGGKPGEIKTSLTGLTPSAQVMIGTAFGFPVKTVFVDVDIEFNQGHYWMLPVMHAPGGESGGYFWEVTTVGSLGLPIVTSEANGPWAANEDGANGVFKLHCEAVTPPEEECMFDITSAVEPITRVVLSDIDNSSDANSTEALEDFTSITGHLAQGVSYTVELEGYTGGPFTNYFTLWIDFDQSGTYDSNEMFEIGSITNSTGTDGQQAVGIVTIPSDAMMGTTTMRIIKNYGSSPTDPCLPYSFGQGEDYSIEIIELNDCNGTPDGGTVTITPAQGNAGSTYTVAANGYSVGNGLTYQWQSNTNDEGWMDMGDTTDAYEAYTATAPGEVGDEVEWRLEVTCIASGESSYSDTAVFTVIMEYCEPSALFVEPITRVVFAGIDNTSSPNSDQDFEDFTSIVGEVDKTVTYDIALEGNTEGSFDNYFTVWIDWDNNGTFESTEMFEIGFINGSTGTDGQQAIGSITIPADAITGVTRMRVIKNFGESPTDPCGDYFFGQIEDYSININSLGVSDFNNNQFAYWPNPVKNVLNLSSEKSVESVDIFNLTGQSVIMNTKPVEGQIDVSSLSTGTYIFKVTLENGLVKTFKIIKK